jgi:hypothetical protein
MKIYQKKFNFFFISPHQNLKKTLKSINSMSFQVKCTLKFTKNKKLSHSEILDN